MEIDTPAVVIDMAVVARNIARTQKHFDALGIALRPHIKTHKIPRLAIRQLAAGARGITCQKIGEAEVMADAGIDDILITYNIVGASKLRRLRALADRCRLSVTADNAAVIEGLSRSFGDAAAPLPVLVECDTGHGRCGVQTSEEALDLARRIDAAPGLSFDGLMTFPPSDDMGPVDEWMRAARALLAENGLTCRRISGGGTPNMRHAGDLTIATEHRAGTYIYNDRSMVEAGACAVEDCALTVAATVVSRPTETRAVIDAGSKALTSDLLGMTDYGLIAKAPGARIVSLSEEHGVIDLSDSTWRPEVGEQVAIIPNHACPVSNLFDQVHFVDGDGGIETVEVAARGLCR